MRIELDYDATELKRASGNYLDGCYEVEIIKNTSPADTNYRIEFIDNDYINISMQELAVLKRILNDPIVTKKLDLDREL